MRNFLVYYDRLPFPWRTFFIITDGEIRWNNLFSLDDDSKWWENCRQYLRIRSTREIAPPSPFYSIAGTPSSSLLCLSHPHLLFSTAGWDGRDKYGPANLPIKFPFPDVNIFIFFNYFLLLKLIPLVNSIYFFMRENLLENSIVWVFFGKRPLRLFWVSTIYTL